MSTTSKSKSKAPVLSDQGKHSVAFLCSKAEPHQPEIQQNYIRMQTELQGLAGKIGELEQETDEHE